MIDFRRIASALIGAMARHRIDVRWVEQWLASGGYRPNEQNENRIVAPMQ